MFWATFLQKYINRKVLIVAVVFGLASMFTIAGGIQFVIPSTNAATDPREIFNSLGSALSGPIGAIIIAILSTLKGSSADIQFFVTFQHLMSAVWVGWAYKNIAYKKYSMPALALVWFLIMLVYYIPTYIPGYVALYFFKNDLWRQFVGNDLSFWSATIKLYFGWIPEIIFSTIFTTLVIVALPENYRKPLWGKELKTNNLKITGINKNNIYYKYFVNNFIGVRLSLWFIILFAISFFYISILTRNYFSEYIIKQESVRQENDAKHIAMQLEDLNNNDLANFLNNINNNMIREIFLGDKNLNPMFGKSLDFMTAGQKNIIQHNKYGVYVDLERKISIGYSYIKNKNLFVLIKSDLNVFDTDLNSIINFLFYNLGITLLFISLLGIGIIYLIVGKPLKKLTLVAEEIGKQNYDVEIDSEAMTDEIKELASAVEEMKNNIKFTRKGLIENRRRLSTLSEATFEGIVISEDGIIIDANKQFSDMLGYNIGELIGLSMLDLIAEESLEVVKSAILSETELPYEHYAKRKDGSIFPVEIRDRKIKMEDHILRLTAVRDITSIKKYQTDLLDAKERAENSNRLKSEFLAQMSHEIRSPLNVMLSFLSLIKEETNKNESPELNESFLSIETAGKRIIRTVDLILNMSEIQVGSYEPSFDYFDIYEDVIKGIIIEYNGMLKNRGLKLELEIETTNTKLYADQYSVSQIIVNLYDNAIKYTESGSITMRIGRNTLDELRIEVEDTGIGISEKYLPHLFDSFSQEEQGYTRSYEGSGLGLTLVKKYCEINNADISVESKKHEGTKFTINFNAIP